MICAIASVDKNWGIGSNNKLLARIPDDMKFFKDITQGKIVIMGRKTFESLPNGPLKNRINVVITRDVNVKYPGLMFLNSADPCYVSMDSIKKWLSEQKKIGSTVANNDIFIIGGGMIYHELLPFCDRIYLTKIFYSYDNVDTWFPNIDTMNEWELKSLGDIKIYNNVSYQFCIYNHKEECVMDEKNTVINNDSTNVFDNVNHPSHYTNSGMECIDEMELVFGTEAVKNFCLLNVWKYRKRAIYKNGEEDQEKSNWYMSKYKELCDKQKPKTTTLQNLSELSKYCSVTTASNSIPSYNNEK